MSDIAWPKSLRKKKEYTAHELVRANCLAAARAIIKANKGKGELIEILPPEGGVRLGPVYPPAGGEISEWFDHRAVLFEGRYYDCMTGPNGMTEPAYRSLFKYGDDLIFRKAGEP